MWKPFLVWWWTKKKKNPNQNKNTKTKTGGGQALACKIDFADPAKGRSVKDAAGSGWEPFGLVWPWWGCWINLDLGVTSLTGRGGAHCKVPPHVPWESRLLPLGSLPYHRQNVIIGVIVGVIDVKKLEYNACWFLAMLWKFLKPSHLDYYFPNENHRLNPEMAPSFWTGPLNM